MQYENTGEALRQRSVVDAINTAGLRSSIMAEAARSELQRAETERLRATNPFAAQAQEAETLARVVGALTQARALENQVTPTERAIDRANEMARHRESLAEGARRHDTTLGQRQSEMDEDKRRYEGESVSVEFPQTDGTTITRRMSAVEAARAVREEGAMIRREVHEKRMADKDIITQRRQDRDAATEAEATLLYNPNDPASIPKVAEYNSKSDNPYIYGYDAGNKGWLSGTKVYRIPLVDAKGKHYRARDVTKKAREMGYATVEEFVEKELYKGREMPRESIK